MLTLTDISALEQARARLAQLSAIVESSDDAIVGKTLDGVITTWNNGAARLYGYTRGRGDRPARQLPLAARAQGGDRRRPAAGPRRPAGRAAGDARGCARTAALVDVSVTFSPILDAAQRDRRHLGISRDITQLVRARQEIAEREERIRLLLDSTAEAIYGIDLSGVCTFCNSGLRAAARLRLAGGADRQADAPADSPHPAGRHAVPAGAVADLRGDAAPRGSARRRRSALAGRRHVVPGGVLEPSDPPQRRGDRRGRHVPRHHRAAAGRGGDPGRRAAARAVPGDAVARAAQSAGGDPERDARARQRAAGPTTPARRRARSSSARPTTWRGCSTTCSTSRASRAAGSSLRNELLDLRDTARSAIEALGPFMAEHETQLDGRHRRRADARLRRSRAAAADPGEPAQQRVEVLAARRRRCASSCAATATRR